MNGNQNQNNDAKDRPAPMAVRREGPSDGIMGGDVDIQVRTAKAFPRSIGEAKERAIELATFDKETAEACSYAVPRAGKIIEGPSVRCMEICAVAFGNMRVAAKTTGEDDGFVYSKSVAWDLESNYALSWETKRRITNRKGERFGDDMIQTTSAAGTAIALRNSIHRVLPRAFVKEVWLAARKAAAGSAKTLKQRRTEMLQYFGGQGVSEQKVLDLLDIHKIDDLTLDHLTTLRGIATSIKDGVTTIETIFSRPEEKEEKPGDEKAVPAEERPSKTESVDKPVDLATRKAQLIDDIVNQIQTIHPGDNVQNQAKRLRLLNETFGRVELAKIELLPVEILQAAIVTLKNQANIAAAEVDDIPI